MLNQNKTRLAFAVGISFSLVAILASQPAHALMRGGKEGINLLSVGSGMVAPSVNTAIDENPAGLSNNETTKVVGLVQSESSSMSPLGYGGGVFAGNGTVGASVGLRNTTGGTSSQALQFGLAAEVAALNFALGVTGNYALSSGSSLSGNVGLIFNNRGQLRFGATAFGLSQGSISSYGTGVSYDIGPAAKFVVDASADSNLKGIKMKPGLGVAVDSLQLAMGYGFDVTNGGSSQIRTGAAFGLGYGIAQSFHIQFYYNQIAKYYGALTIRL